VGRDLDPARPGPHRRSLTQHLNTHHTQTAQVSQSYQPVTYILVPHPLHSVYDQPDAASVQAQYDRLVDAVAGKLPKVAEHLDAARADVLAFTGFPKELWRQILTTAANNHSYPDQSCQRPALRSRHEASGSVGGRSG
jgi:hypothetical protein